MILKVSLFLKDAASAAIYGAQAGNGVVLITTRKAKKEFVVFLMISSCPPSL